ncbi:hypothetical protein CR983_00710 [Candidatus Saccharibacteria bacterium]|nr:MAG: hypothetical protein CR983_00710 [Candidatus Saccharibacteria bacterium]
MVRRKQQFDYDLIVIGSGAAGSTAALAAAKDDHRVALMEASTFGGESPNWGDVPSKALLHAATLYDEARRASRFGIRSNMLSHNFPSLMQWKDRAIARTGAADNRAYYNQVGIDTHHGHAHFLSPHEVSVNRTHVTASHFLIASGSIFETPNIYGIETIHYRTPQTIFDVKRLPRTLFIIGSSAEAIEYAQLFSILGTKVYLAERSARLLPDEDIEVGELFERYLHDVHGVNCLTQAQVVGFEKRGYGAQVAYRRGQTSRSVHTEEILFVDNRAPATDLGLENASVYYTPAGIDVNDYLQTSAKHIYAAGDVLGGACPTHLAMQQGRVALYNMFHKSPQKADATASLPRITYTFPGIASVGLSENDCIKRDLAIHSALVPLSMVSRSNASDFVDGFVKLITDKKGALIGATVVAPHAAEIIHELTLAIHHGMTAADIANTPHAFLSWSEAVRAAAVKLAH